MQANELMIDDIVRVAKDVCIPKGTVVSIRGVDADNCFREKHLVGSATCYINKYSMTCGVWVEYLEPIPLAPEILEKLGFTNNPYFKGIYMKEINKRCQILYYVDTHRLMISYCGSYVSKNAIKYLHELQHALRFVGLSGIADNLIM